MVPVFATAVILTIMHGRAILATRSSCRSADVPGNAVVALRRCRPVEQLHLERKHERFR